MHYRCAILFLGIVMLSLPTQASPIPDDVLKKNYETCLKGNGSPEDPADFEAKKAYCACTRDKLALLWDFDSFARFSEQAAKGAASTEDMDKLKAMANDCVAKVLK